MRKHGVGSSLTDGVIVSKSAASDPTVIAGPGGPMA
jgi:hypothetical protein